MSFIIKVSYPENVELILSKKIFTHDGIYNFKDEIKNGDTVFLYLGGDKSKISWDQGLVGYGKVIREPYDIGYQGRNFRIDVEPNFLLDSPIPPKETKLHQKFRYELYDVPYVGANHFPTQAIAKVQDTGERALYSILSLKNDEKSGSLSNSPQKINHDLAIKVSKPFLLLAGISGTGKTRFVREQAKATGSLAETYRLTSVRPDWHEPSDLLGYISRLNGAAEYITTDVLQFIAKAWRTIADSGLNIEAQGERLVVTGERDKLDKVLPYWLCLDEMNLAPVEQYFADYLSVLETREWDWKEDGSFTYSCDALLKSTTIKEVADKDKLRKALGFDDGQYDELWTSICQYGLGIPFNLLVAGTVNMDETTHGFSRKVIDRALSFDFGEFFPNDYKDFFSSRYENKRLTYPMLSHAKEEMLSSLPDKFGDKTIAFLTAVNDELKNTPFELAYRALNELLLAVVSSQPKDEQALQAVWDDFMMCKVLPRIEGDEDKLMGSNEGGQNILERLLSVLENQLTGIWNDGRPDLYRELKDKSDGASLVDCRSKKKLKWMNEQLVRGFVSFWP